MRIVAYFAAFGQEVDRNCFLRKEDFLIQNKVMLFSSKYFKILNIAISQGEINGQCIHAGRFLETGN